MKFWPNSAIARTRLPHCTPQRRFEGGRPIIGFYFGTAPHSGAVFTENIVTPKLGVGICLQPLTFSSSFLPQAMPSSSVTQAAQSRYGTRRQNTFLGLRKARL